MKKLLLAIATTLVFSMPVFAGTDDSQDFKSLSAKLWKAPKATSAMTNQKDDLTIVYGGEDVSHKLSSDSYTG